MLVQNRSVTIFDFRYTIIVVKINHVNRAVGGEGISLAVILSGSIARYAVLPHIYTHIYIYTYMCMHT